MGFAEGVLCCMSFAAGSLLQGFLAPGVCMGFPEGSFCYRGLHGLWCRVLCCMSFVAEALCCSGLHATFSG